MSLQHVVVVGGSSGIGLATVKLLLEQGFAVTATGRNEEKLAQVKASLRGDLRTMAFDAMDAGAIAAAFAGIGSIDHLVLALGSGHGAGPFATLAMSDLLAGFQTKVIPQAAVAQAALPFLAPEGSITFVSAVSAQAALPGTAGLAAVNAAIAAIVRVLAVELKPCRCNGVSPGVVDTPWWDAVPQQQRAALFADFAGRTPVGRVGQPQDVAKTISFLIGNGFMSGHIVTCDGGLSLAG